MIDNTSPTAPAEPAPVVILAEPAPADLARLAEREAAAELARLARRAHTVALLTTRRAGRPTRRQRAAAALGLGVAGWLLLLALVATLAALAGCSRPAEPAAAPSHPPATLAPSPTATAPDTRAACNEVVRLGNAFEFDPTANLAAGQVAAVVAEPGISAAGHRLAAAAEAAMVPPTADPAGAAVAANLAISEAQLAVAQACADEYGDGPW